MLHAVIMAGGSGTRFWPQSRTRLPKQLLQLAGDRTMIQQTADRCSSFVSAEHTWVVTNALQAQATHRQLPEVPQNNILVEPAARNTAPCVGLAAIHVAAQDPDGIMFVMPADHVISPTEVFRSAAHKAVELVQEKSERLVLFGVPPAFPSTGYGYIERGGAMDQPASFAVKSFREKPAEETAREYIQTGQFYWNCGIFCWKAKTILDCLAEFEPESFERLQVLSRAIGSSEWDQTLESAFPEMNSISIDCAVLERAEHVCVIEAPFQWDDVGSWLAVPRLAGTDDDGNTLDGLVRTLDSRNCIVRTDDQHLVATLGVEDLIIVHTPDATLVARRDDSERIKQLLDLLKSTGGDAFL